MNFEPRLRPRANLMRQNVGPDPTFDFSLAKNIPPRAERHCLQLRREFFNLQY